jgi:ABC-type branched-subunit amino acid transport system ATPase component
VWLALATLAAGFIADQMLFRIPAINGTGQGRPIPRPSFGPFDFNHPTSYAMLLLLIFGVLAGGVHNLLNSPTGRVMIGMRSSEVAAATSGSSTVVPKFVLFGASAAIAGIGGTLLAAHNYRIDPLNFPTPVGMVWVAVIAVLGVRRIGGALLAGLMVPLFPELLRHVTDTTLLPPILFGLGAINLAQNPDGVMAIEGIKRYEKRRRRALLSVDAAQDLAATNTTPSTAQPHDDRPAAVELSGVHAGYDGVAVLREIDLRIPRGSFVLVVGANGAGKSTLCAVIAGLVTPTLGTVVLDGADITKSKAHERVRRGLILAPEYRGVFPNLTVEDNVSVWMSDQPERERALKRFPVLADRRHRSAQLLSGGEQQMLALAPLLEHPPSVLLVDEPSLGLSPSATRQVFAALSEIHASGTTVVVIEEQAHRALDLAELVVMLDRGRIVWTGPVDGMTDELDRLYLGKAAP